MANHVRQQLREALGTLLTGLTTTGNRVYQSRVRRLSPAELPALRIYTDGDDAETISMGRPAAQDRIVEIRVEAVAKASDNLDNTLDTICKEVETVIGNNPTLSGKARDCLYTGAKIDLQENGDSQVGVATLSFTADAQTMNNAPDTLI